MDNSTPAAKPKAYARARLIVSLAGGGLNLGLLIAFLWSGGSLAFAHSLSPGPGLRVLEYVAAVGAAFWLLTLPFDLAGRGIEIRFGMNRQGIGSWWGDQVKELALAAVLGIAAAELLYWLLRIAPAHWWLWTWAGVSLFVVAMAQLGPVLLLPLFFKFRQMSEDDPTDGPLVRRLLATYSNLRASDPRLPSLHGIFEWKLGEKSAKANAALTGLGRTRRVIISDTLLQSSSPEEIEAVFVHELGHHVHHDIWRGLGFQCGLIFLGLWLAELALQRLATVLNLISIADVAGLPLILIVFTLLGLALLPASNGFVRAMERRADDYSFATLGSAAPLISGLRKLADKNLAEVEPPRWKEWLLYSHPSIATRVRRGETWQAAHAATQIRDQAN